MITITIEIQEQIDGKITIEKQAEGYVDPTTAEIVAACDICNLINRFAATSKEVQH